MRLLTKRQGSGGHGDLVGHVIGNALVVRPKHLLREEVRDLALGLAADVEHELVVVDLPVDSSFAVWESAAKLMPRRRRGVRLVISGRSRETTALAGQWLSERLNRTVIAPDGAVMRGVGGSLFVDSGWGTGWVRFQPGKPPKADGKRFPRPAWEIASPLVEVMPTSAGSVAEPLPGGVWLRPCGPESVLRAHRKRLIEAMPAQPDVCTVVLGCPGAPPISMYDVTRFWGWLPAELRERLKLVQFGPFTLPGKDIAVGQAIADAVGERITCYTGIPVGSRARPDVFTLRADGTLGWRAFAEELVYAPSGGTATVPLLSAYREPIFGIEEVAPAVYRYAPGVVLEVVPAGLWLRPDRELPHAPAVRSALPDSEQHLVLFEDSQGEVIREVATDVLGRLEAATRRLSGLVRADAVLRSRAEVAGAAMAAIDPPATTRELAADEPVEPDSPAEMTLTMRFDAVLPDALSPMTAAEADVMRPSWALEAAGAHEIVDGISPAVLGAGLQDYSAVSLGLADEPESAPGTPEVTDAPLPTAGMAGGAMPATPVIPAVAQASVAHLPGGQGSPPPTLVGGPASERDLPVATPSALVGGLLPPLPPVAEVIVAGGPEVTGSAGPVVRRRPRGRSTRSSTTASPAVTEQHPAVGPRSGTAQPADAAPEAPPLVSATPARPSGEPRVVSRIQPTPSAAAAALMPQRGLDEERGWLRRTLAREYAAVANSVSRIMSEHPGFHGAVQRSAGVLTDAVAIRLYLSGEGDQLDLALRTGAVGPHVPFARCVVSGLSRLPSHRGAAVFATSPTEKEWELYRSRKLFTEWGFVHALSQPCVTQRGANEVDVVLWSMTARRTRLLEPERHPTADRVLFVPGTSFKVLDLVEPKDGGRGQVLLRELAAGEIDSSGRVAENRASLDELALNSLRRSMESWNKATPETRVPEASEGRFSLLPGLVRTNEEER
ncbi:hypothetical protein [Lentzea sp. NPDC004782]|uniref:hypothetical protein n=1 Tax=Lentzea sp. NPDC004782 TaxID=3154458 RepID=UPI0033B9FC91